jgi:hypothetical protein
MMNRTLFEFRRPVLVPFIAAAVLLCGVSAGAQQPVSEQPLSFGLGLGAAARPGGSIGSLGLATLELGTPWRNLDVRLDGVFTSWPGKVSGGRVTSLTTNLVYSRPVGGFAPYLIGGIGGYAQQGVGASVGVNGGIGIKAFVSRVQPFIELREHVWSTDRTRRATPLTLGLMF